MSPLAVESNATSRLGGLKTPQASGMSLIEPPFSSVGLLLSDNACRVASVAELDLGGKTLAALRADARNELSTAAINYTESYRDVSFIADRVQSDDRPIILSGHQPQLFHPGVWFKNFALHRIAADHDGVAINLLIDNDVTSPPSIQVPTGSRERPRVVSVPYDHVATDMSWELREIHDELLFASFPDRVRETIQPFVEDPLVTSLWKHVAQIRRITRNLGQCLAAGRHRLEGDWGLTTLEVPLSHLCDTPTFDFFAACIVLRLERFQQSYNQAINAYRQTHRLRSQSHPAPLLTRDAEWMETPFWIYSADQPTRQPLFMRIQGRELEFRAGGKTSERPAFRVSVAEDVTGFAHNLRISLGDSTSKSAWKIRPRALMTTLYSRLFLSDLFVHGIGGAKYDEVTDRIMDDFFGAPAPTYLTATMTLRLEAERPFVDRDDIRQINGLIRELWYHPEQLEPPATLRSAKMSNFLRWSEEKTRHLSQRPQSGSRKSWHDELQQINTQLRTVVASCRNDLLAERERLVYQRRIDTLMSSREHSYCLFPTERIKHILLDLCGLNP